MFLESIKLLNFRNFEVFNSGSFSKKNIFVGQNGVGKTNVIEAIQLITALQSFKNPKWNEVIKWGSDNSGIEALMLGDGRELKIRLKIGNGKRIYYLNDKNKKRGEIQGTLPSVLFCPDDLFLVKGSSGKRRDALDLIGSQISSTYSDLKTDYQKAVRNKTLLLQSEKYSDSLLDAWDENISLLGSIFVKHRLNLFSIFRKKFIATYSAMIKKAEIDIEYIPSWQDTWQDDDKNQAPQALQAPQPPQAPQASSCELETEQIQALIYKNLISIRNKEISSKKVLTGPHLDDIKISLNGHDARKYASQGQQRFTSLVWKITEMETIKQISGQQAILLLDDVMSELDKEKRKILTDYLSENIQSFITTVDLENIDKTYLSEARIYEIGQA